VAWSWGLLAAAAIIRGSACRILMRRHPVWTRRRATAAPAERATMLRPLGAEATGASPRAAASRSWVGRRKLRPEPAVPRQAGAQLAVSRKPGAPRRKVVPRELPVPRKPGAPRRKVAPRELAVPRKPGVLRKKVARRPREALGELPA